MTNDTHAEKSNTLLINNARLIDGLGSVHGELQSIYVQDGEFAAIDRDIDIMDVRLPDVGGER
jgi:dihydroorotase-like cyclic amidohydrolase